MNLTFGLELEWADVDRHAPLPADCGTWNDLDTTIVNSDGHANDPTGRTWRWGGEINTVPTDDPAEVARQVRVLTDLLAPTINYRCNLHVHVGVPGLADDLALLKQVNRYARINAPFVYAVVDPIPMPTPAEYPDPEHLKGALARYRRRHVSHQHQIADDRYAEAQNATDITGFWLAHSAPLPDGRRSNRSPRSGINLRSVRKRGTIEFRHFPGTADPTEAQHAVEWCRDFTAAAVGDQTPAADLYAARPWTFPTFRPYDHLLETGWRATKFDHPSGF